MKPRIKKRVYYWWSGLPASWTCSDGKATGVGMTPAEAYADWQTERDIIHNNAWKRKWLASCFN
jgi:hypothetical protein